VVFEADPIFGFFVFLFGSIEMVFNLSMIMMLESSRTQTRRKLTTAVIQILMLLTKIEIRRLLTEHLSIGTQIRVLTQAFAPFYSTAVE
jgi:hypothetical protein